MNDSKTIIPIGTLDDEPEFIVCLVKITEELCKKTGRDPADAIMLLLGSATLIYDQYSAKAGSDRAETLHGSLDLAMRASASWFEVAKTEPRH